MKRIYRSPKTIIALVFILALNLSCSLKTSDSKEKNEDFKNVKSDNPEAEALVNYMVNELMKLPSMPPGISLAISSNNNIIF